MVFHGVTGNESTRCLPMNVCENEICEAIRIINKEKKISLPGKRVRLFII